MAGLCHSWRLAFRLRSQRPLRYTHTRNTVGQRPPPEDFLYRMEATTMRGFTQRAGESPPTPPRKPRWQRPPPEGFLYRMEATTMRGFTQRDAVSPLTRHVLGLGILLLTVVPAYLVSQANLASPDSEAVKMARENATDTSVEITQIVEIEAHIREVAVRYDIPPILVAAIVEAESELNPRAASRPGPQGLMQLMPDTASSLRVADSFDPYENIEGG